MSELLVKAEDFGLPVHAGLVGVGGYLSAEAGGQFTVEGRVLGVAGGEQGGEQRLAGGGGVFYPEQDLKQVVGVEVGQGTAEVAAQVGPGGGGALAGGLIQRAAYRRGQPGPRGRSAPGARPREAPGWALSFPGQ
ncbi:hypothetical protein [Kitasatospora sp. NPDC059803]|uniref:hypothetical protein n=1 Tax=Kitasatospora sp. NPDC059803 TaxID=3346953 RepID=UPI00366580FC